MNHIHEVDFKRLVNSFFDFAFQLIAVHHRLMISHSVLYLMVSRIRLRTPWVKAYHTRVTRATLEQVEVSLVMNRVDGSAMDKDARVSQLKLTRKNENGVYQGYLLF